MTLIRELVKDIQDIQGIMWPAIIKNASYAIRAARGQQKKPPHFSFGLTNISFNVVRL
jgi:hypothetical protein